MGCLGVHLALTDDEVVHLRTLPTEQERLDYLLEELEEIYFAEHEQYLAESDKAWDAIHRTLTDGDLEWMIGDYPLDHVILGGELLYTKSDYLMSLKTPEIVHDIAAALPLVSEQEFRSRYFEIDQEKYGSPVDEQDFAYTWEWFQNVRRLYANAANDGRHVLFSASQ